MQDTFRNGWLLVMAMWGRKFHEGYVNVLARSVRGNSPDCSGALLITDKRRDAIDPWVSQVPIPSEFDRPEFYRPGYPVKLSIFAAPEIPSRTRCIFLDLDTLVTGDLTPLARRIQRPDDMLMLPPATIGFNAVSRLLYKLSDGTRFRTGNSSVIAYGSDGGRALAKQYLALWKDPTTRDLPFLSVDDHFISWAAQPILRDVPRSSAVMLRREFLSRIPYWPAVKSRLPWTVRRRAHLAAITLNGVDYKPDILLALEDGAPVNDAKGRTGTWDAKSFGALLPKIRKLSAAIQSNQTEI